MLWAARALERRMSLRSGLALTEVRWLGEGSRRGVAATIALGWVVTGGGIGGRVGGEEGMGRGGVGMLPVVVDVVWVSVGFVGAGGGGIGLVCVGSMREYMRLWNSCVSSGVIMWSDGKRKEKVGQWGTSSGCGGYPCTSVYVSRKWRSAVLVSAGRRMASWKSSRRDCWVVWTSASRGSRGSAAKVRCDSLGGMWARRYAPRDCRYCSCVVSVGLGGSSRSRQWGRSLMVIWRPVPWRNCRRSWFRMSRCVEG